VRVTDPLGGVTQYAYDDLSRLVSQTDPYGAITRSGYDALGDRTSQTDRDGRTTRWIYDALQRLVEESWLDAQGNAIATIARTYDTLGRLYWIVVSDSVFTTTYYVLVQMISMAKQRRSAQPTVS